MRTWREFHRLDCRNRKWHSLNAEQRMTDSRSGENSLRELEFNDLNIHLYLTLNYGTTSEHLDFDLMVLYNVFVLSWGLTITRNSIHTISDLDRSHRYPIRRKPYQSRYRSWVSYWCIPNYKYLIFGIWLRNPGAICIKPLRVKF